MPVYHGGPTETLEHFLGRIFLDTVNRNSSLERLYNHLLEIAPKLFEKGGEGEVITMAKNVCDLALEFLPQACYNPDEKGYQSTVKVNNNGVDRAYSYLSSLKIRFDI